MFLPHLPGAGSGHGFHQLLADPELEQLVGDEYVAALPGAVFADRDLLPADTDDAVRADLPRRPAVAVSSRGGRRLDYR